MFYLVMSREEYRVDDRYDDYYVPYYFDTFLLPNEFELKLRVINQANADAAKCIENASYYIKDFVERKKYDYFYTDISVVPLNVSNSPEEAQKKITEYSLRYTEYYKQSLLERLEEAVEDYERLCKEESESDQQKADKEEYELFLKLKQKYEV